MKNTLRIYILLSLTLFSLNQVKAQTELKFNAATALLLVPNFGIETPLSKDLSFQLDVLGSFWDSFDGLPYQVVQVFPELRYYTKPDHCGFFAGAHVGFGMFTLQKWGHPDEYESGQNTYLGFSIGYKKRINQNWAYEVFIGAGHTEARYKGYTIDEETRSDLKISEVRDFNRSGEQIPYRGGLMVNYTLQTK